MTPHLGIDDGTGRSVGETGHLVDSINDNGHLRVYRCCCKFNSDSNQCCYSDEARPTGVLFTQRKCYYSNSGCTVNIAPPSGRTGSYVRMNNDVALNASSWQWHSFTDNIGCTCWVTKSKHSMHYIETFAVDGSSCPGSPGSTVGGYPLISDDAYIALTASSSGPWAIRYSTASQSAACSASVAFSFSGLESTPTETTSCCGGAFDVATACISDAANYYKIETAATLNFTSNKCCTCDDAGWNCVPTSDESSSVCGNGENTCTDGTGGSNDQNDLCPP